MVLNILHAPTRWDIGGTEKAAELFIREHSDNFNAYGVGSHHGGPRADSLRESGHDVYEPDGVDDLAEYMCSKEIDIVHSHSGDTNLIGEAAADAGVPIHVRTDQFGNYFETDSGSGIDYFFYPSKTILLRTQILNNIRVDGKWSEEMTHLYNPLDVDEVTQGESLRDEYGIPDSVPVVGKIGRPVPEKWGKLTVRAFNRALDRTPDARLFLVGVPEKIRKEIRSHEWENKVTYVDPLPPEKVSDFYATIDVLAHTSAIGESYGYVIAEAMANGVPPVVDSTPMRDNAQVELVNNGEAGYVANSPAAYGDALSELLDDEAHRERLSEAAKRRASEFDVTRVVTRLERFYERLAADAGLIQPGTAHSFDDLTGDMSEFGSEYDRRISDTFGDDDLLHQLERASWGGVEKLPVGRKPIFELLRKGFIFSNEYV